MLADERYFDPGCRNTADEARRAEIMLEGEGSEFAVIIFIGCGGGIAVARPELGVDERRQAVVWRHDLRRNRGLHHRRRHQTDDAIIVGQSAGANVEQDDVPGGSGGNHAVVTDGAGCLPVQYAVRFQQRLQAVVGRCRNVQVGHHFGKIDADFLVDGQYHLHRVIVEGDVLGKEWCSQEGG